MIKSYTVKRFGDVTMKKKDETQTFSIMRKPIKVDGGDVRMSPAEPLPAMPNLLNAHAPNVLASRLGFSIGIVTYCHLAEFLVNILTAPIACVISIHLSN